MSEQLEELRNELREIKKQYAIYNGELFWRYSFRALGARSRCFTHIYCLNCKYLADREDPRHIECFKLGHHFYNLEEYEMSVK